MECRPYVNRWVTLRLFDRAAEDWPDGGRRATDLAGPDVFTLPESSSRLRTHAARGVPRVLTLPPVGGVLRSFANRTNLPSREAEIGGASFHDWLVGRCVAPAQPDPPECSWSTTSRWCGQASGCHAPPRTNWHSAPRPGDEPGPPTH